MREVALAREIREAGVSEMGYLYMGSYSSVLSSLFFFLPFTIKDSISTRVKRCDTRANIHLLILLTLYVFRRTTTVCMTHGGQETYQWFPMKGCIPLMEKYRYACFSDPSHSIEGDAEPGMACFTCETVG